MRSDRVQSGGKEKHGAGFTLVELLVSLLILSLLTAIAIPGFSALQRKAIQLRGMSNLKQIHNSVSLFANDHGDRYPPSVSWIGGPLPQAYHPRRLVSSTKPRGAIHRSMSGYLHEYMSDVSLWTCPAAPKKVPDMQEMWDAGDDYVSRSGSAAFSGHYCFFWGWTGLIEGETTNGPRPVFRGPRGPGAGRKSSSLLVSDCFGKDINTDLPGYASCEWFEGASESISKDISAVYWLEEKDRSSLRSPPLPEVTLKAAYVDGHVALYDVSESLARVRVDRGDGHPNKKDGYYYIPEEGVPQKR